MRARHRTLRSSSVFVTNTRTPSTSTFLLPRADDACAGVSAVVPAWVDRHQRVSRHHCVPRFLWGTHISQARGIYVRHQMCWEMMLCVLPPASTAMTLIIARREIWK
ncbi:hypothetical protein TcCL_Unassigned01351 [Trypanosoma cruzi]|nr:hypothetical protein TcCL_Unassigned01351 [Trypanosoma cruzi]